MISKQQLRDAMLKECDVCIHLHSKLEPAAAEYRPSPPQRSTLELLRYLSVVGIAATRCMEASDWKLYGEYSERAQAMALDDFPAAMARQKDELTEFFAGVGEETLESQEADLPGGGKVPLGVAILNGPLKWLAAYKLQLFLYAKACGATEIGTTNAWAGADAEAKG